MSAVSAKPSGAIGLLHAPPRRPSARASEPLLLLAPALVFLGAVGIYPFLYGLYISFTNMNTVSAAGAKQIFIGLANYTFVLTNGVVLGAVGTSFLYVAGTVTVSVLLGTGIALLLQLNLRGINIFRTLILIPMVITPVVIGVTWRFMYNPEFGVIPWALRQLGFGDAQVGWLASPLMALPAVVLTDVWEWTPFCALIVLAGLQSLPAEPYEAARIDGASSVQTFRYLTLPLLVPTLLVAVTIRSIDAFKTFDTLYVLTAGGPGWATETLNMHAYKFAFQWGNIGQGAALAILIGLLVTVISRLYIRLLPARL